MANPSTPKLSSVESWLKSLDNSMLRYTEDFRKLDFNNTKTLKFFKNEDFENFSVKPSTAHRRMIINAVAKLQTPQSKLGLEDEPRRRNVLEPRKLSYVADHLFREDQAESEDDAPEFVYQSPTELMLQELKVRAFYLNL